MGPNRSQPDSSFPLRAGCHRHCDRTSNSHPAYALTDLGKHTSKLSKSSKRPIKTKWRNNDQMYPLTGNKQKMANVYERTKKLLEIISEFRKGAE